MSQMPDKIWLHKNTKYSTGDIVCGYQYDFVQGIEDEGGIENFVEYVPSDAFIEKAAKWVKERAELFLLKTPMCDYYDYKKAVKDFENYMKGE